MFCKSFLPLVTLVTMFRSAYRNENMHVVREWKMFELDQRVFNLFWVMDPFVV